MTRFLRIFLFLTPFILLPSAHATNFYDCNTNLKCDPIQIIGDPYAKEKNGEKSLFRGYGDPDLAYDEKNNTVWMSYSWLQNLNPQAKKKIVNGVEQHLAKYDGKNFQFVKTIKGNEQKIGVKGDDGWMIHEVSSLTPSTNNNWHLLWMSYHMTKEGTPYKGGLFYHETTAEIPDKLGTKISRALYGTGTDKKFQPIDFNLSSIPEIGQCQLFTEPAHLLYNNTLYLGINCMRFGLFGRMPKKERFVLLKKTNNGYSYVADIFNYSDAQSIEGSERIEQIDFFIQKDGRVGLLGTPIKITNRFDDHLGCYFMTFSDFEKGQVIRDTSGKPKINMIIKDTMSKPLGSGACSYNTHYDGGVLIIRRLLPPATHGIEFTLLKTGIHP